MTFSLQFQRITPVSRAIWQRYTHPERQTIERCKGELPTVTSRAAPDDAGSCMYAVHMSEPSRRAF